jgi:hypothetical protein
MTDDAARLNQTPIDVSTVTQKAKERMQNQLGFDTTRQNKILSDIGLAIPDRMAGQGVTTGTSPANIGYVKPEQALQLERQLQAQAAAYRRAYLQNKTPEMKVMRDTLNSAALEMKSLLDRSFGGTAQEAIQQVKTPDRIAALNNAVPGLGDRVAKESVNSLSQLRATNAPLVQGIILAQETEDQLSRIFQQTGTRLASQMVAAIAGSSAYGPVGMLGGMTLGPAVMEPLATYARSKAAVPLAGMASKAIQNASQGGLKAGMMQGTSNILNTLGSGLQSPAAQTAGIEGARSFWNALGGGKYGRQ